VVAHPDDEVLWAGGLPLRFPGNWTVVCCSTPDKDPLRAEHFFDACDVLGAQGKIYPEKDIKKTPLKALDQVNLEEFDHIFTHNRWGEQGHPHHQQVHQYVVSKYRHKKITTFGYRHQQGRGAHSLILTETELGRKMLALQQYKEVTSYKVRAKCTGFLDYLSRKVTNTLVQHKNGPLWEDLAQFYFTNRNMNPAIETYDGAWI
jgi:hypothetical protein